MSRKSSSSGGLLFIGILLLVVILYESGIIEISGANAFQTGFTLAPLQILGNQIVNYVSSITGISTIVIVLILMAVVLYFALSKGSRGRGW